MISRCEPMSTASAKAKPLVQTAVKSGGYFCANADAIQRAATQVRERCELLHGMAFDGVVGTRVLNKKGEWCNYTVGDCNYDLKCMWATCSPTKPAPLAACAAIFAVNTNTNNSLMQAEQAAVHPIVDYSSIRGLDAKSSFLPSNSEVATSKRSKKVRFSLDSKRGEPTATPVPTKVADDVTDMHGIGTEAGDLSSIAHLTSNYHRKVYHTDAHQASGQSRVRRRIRDAIRQDYHL